MSWSLITPWAYLGRFDCRLWHFARPPHRLALGAHQRHPYDATDQQMTPQIMKPVLKPLSGVAAVSTTLPMT